MLEARGYEILLRKPIHSPCESSGYLLLKLHLGLWEFLNPGSLQLDK